MPGEKNIDDVPNISNNPLEQVKQFYDYFMPEQIPEESMIPSFSDALEPRVNLKMDLIFEEFLELVRAVYGPKSEKILESVWEDVKSSDESNRDIVETADALGDLIVVVIGLAIEANIPLSKVMREIARSNLSKLENGKPVVSDGVTPASYDGKVKPVGKILKGRNFVEPNIEKVLFGDCQ